MGRNKLTTLPRIFIRVVCCFRSSMLAGALTADVSQFLSKKSVYIGVSGIAGNAKVCTRCQRRRLPNLHHHQVLMTYYCCTNTAEGVSLDD